MLFCDETSQPSLWVLTSGYLCSMEHNIKTALYNMPIVYVVKEWVYNIYQSFYLVKETVLYNICYCFMWWNRLFYITCQLFYVLKENASYSIYQFITIIMFIKHDHSFMWWVKSLSFFFNIKSDNLQRRWGGHLHAKTITIHCRPEFMAHGWHLLF